MDSGTGCSRLPGARLNMAQQSHWQKMEGYICLALFALCIPLANWMVGHIGNVCVTDGPCIVPVWPGIAAPSGVLVVGIALVLRDLVQRRLGLSWAFVAIIGGAVLSWLIAPPALALASVAAFTFSETADLLVFTPLQKKGLMLAVIISSAVGLAVDSVLFLSLAFGSLDFLAGQMIGKAWGIAVALPLVWYMRSRDPKLRAAAA